MKSKNLFIPFFFLLIVLHAADPGYSQASLAAEDMIDDVVVKTRSGAEVVYTLIKDAVQKDQWYYMPAQARMYEIKPAGSGNFEPEFNLIKYQYKNPKNPGELLEGGVIQFSLVMSPDPVSLASMRAALVQRSRNPNARLAALPLKSATVNLITPKGEFIAEGSQTEGIAPLYANQKMVFSISLTKIGTDIYDALTKSNTGLGVAVKFSYNGLTPPAGFKVTVDWDQTYSFYSKNEKTMAEVAGAYKWLGGSASYNKEKQQMVQSLIQNKCLNVEAITGEAFNDTMLKAYLDPIIQRINQELFNTDQFGKRVDSFLMAKSLEKDTSKARDKSGVPLLSWLKVNVGKSIAIKDIRMVKKGKEVISFNIKQMVERNSIAGGFVGLGAYPEDVRKKLQILIADGKWESAFFVLPHVADDADIGIQSVGLEIKLKNKDRYYSGQVFNWTPDKGWTDKDGKSRTVAAFPLLALAADNPDMKGISFEIKASIALPKGEVLEITREQPAMNAEGNIALPLSLVDIIKVDPELLSFSKLSPDSRLDFVSISVSDGQRQTSGKLLPRTLSGAAVPPKPFFWLVPKSESGNRQIKATIQFNLKDGSVVPWKDNGKNLYDPAVGTEIILRDIDYNK